MVEAYLPVVTVAEVEARRIFELFLGTSAVASLWQEAVEGRVMMAAPLTLTAEKEEDSLEGLELPTFTVPVVTEGVEDLNLVGDLGDTSPVTTTMEALDPLVLEARAGPALREGV
eukprot:gene966-biopygen1034